MAPFEVTTARLPAPGCSRWRSGEPRFHPVPYSRHGLSLGEDLGVRADAYLQYCDQAPCSISTRLSSAACGLPGTSLARSPPSAAADAFADSASAFSATRAPAPRSRAPAWKRKVRRSLDRLQIDSCQQSRVCSRRGDSPACGGEMSASMPMRSPLPARIDRGGVGTPR